MIKDLIIRLTTVIPDNIFLFLKYIYKTKRVLVLDAPQTFNEKLQWLKLYDRRPEYTKMVDKYEVKQYVAEKIGEEFIIPTLGVWDRFEDIDFDRLPNQFVLKCTHDSGGIVICKDKSTLNHKNARKKLNYSLKRNYFYAGREWPYKNVKPRIIAEQYMEDSTTRELRDYKIYCFNGAPQYCQVISDRTTKETIDFFDMDWIHQEFTGLGLPHKPFSDTTIKKPVNFEKMKTFARILAEEIPFVRIDFYEINDKLYFGEITFFPASGFGVFHPDKWNYILGDMLKLDVKNA